MLRVPGLDDLRRDRLDGVDRHREPDADVAARAGVAGRDLRVDADHVAARVEQRAAGVALVQGGVGLDHVVDRVAVRRADDALERAHDPGRDGAVVAERVADRDHRVADADGVGVAERQRRQRPRVRVDLQHRDVGRGVGADDLRLHALVVREADVDRARVLDDVVVRDDVAGLVDHEAGAERLGALLGRKGEPEERVDTRRRDDLRRGHLDDPRCGVPVDRVHRERSRLGGGLVQRDRGGQRRGDLAHGGRRVEAPDDRGATERERTSESAGRNQSGPVDRHARVLPRSRYSRGVFNPRYAALSHG